MSSAFKPIGVIFVAILVVAAISFWRRASAPEELIPWRTDLAAAAVEAAAQQKPMLLYFTAAWCGPCQQMKTTTWADARVEEALRAYVAVKINVDRNGDLAREYGAQSIPYFVLQYPESPIPFVTVGYQDTERLLAWLAQAERAARVRPGPGAGEAAPPALDAEEALPLQDQSS